MLQQESPDDYVIATGESHSVQEFLELAAEICGVDWKKHVAIDARYFRPTEVDSLCGDASKARRNLGWRPKVNFPELVRRMVEYDMELARQEQTLLRAGHTCADAEHHAWIKNSRIFVAGHRGLVGSAICRKLESEGLPERHRTDPAGTGPARWRRGGTVFRCRETRICVSGRGQGGRDPGELDLAGRVSARQLAHRMQRHRRRLEARRPQAGSAGVVLYLPEAGARSRSERSPC